MRRIDLFGQGYSEFSGHFFEVVGNLRVVRYHFLAKLFDLFALALLSGKLAKTDLGHAANSRLIHEGFIGRGSFDVPVLGFGGKKVLA